MIQRPLFRLSLGFILAGILLFTGCGNDSGVSDPSGPPEVVSVNPEDNAENVSVDTYVTVTFNQPMDESSIDESTFTLTEDTTALSGTVSTTDTTATLSLEGNLKYETSYTARLSPDITDADDKALPSEYQWNFRTEQAPDEDDGQDEEEDGDNEDEGDTDPPVINSVIPADDSDDVDVDTDITIIFNESLNASTVTTSSVLLQQNGTAVDGAVSTSGEQITFNPEEDLEYNSSYNLTLATDIEDEAGNNLESNYEAGFTTEEQPQDDGEEDNGETSDNTPPVVTGTDPDDGADNVSIEVTISAEFSESMDASTVNDNAFILQSNGQTINGTVDYSGTTATFSPNNELEYSTSYTATLTTSMEDEAGNELENFETFSFTTEQEPDTDPPTVESSSPGGGASDVSTETDITATFNEDMAPSSLNANSVILEGPNGEAAGSINASGSTVTFTPDGSLENDSQYTFIITTEAADLAGNNLQGTYTATFTTEPPADQTPPSVESSSPSDGVTGVSVATDVTVTFDEPLDQSTVSGGSVTLEGPGGGSVPGSVSSTNTTITFTPNNDLENSEEYSLSINTQVTDQAGNALTSPVSITFTTEEPEDTTPPAVESTPANGDINVPVNVDITASFNEEMDQSTLNSANVTLEGPAGTVESAVNATTNSVTLSPQEDLENGQEYTFSISTQVADLAGNTLASPYEASFTTEEDTTGDGENGGDGGEGQ